MNHEWISRQRTRRRRLPCFRTNEQHVGQLFQGVAGVLTALAVLATVIFTLFGVFGVFGVVDMGGVREQGFSLASSASYTCWS